MYINFSVVFFGLFSLHGINIQCKNTDSVRLLHAVINLGDPPVTNSAVQDLKESVKGILKGIFTSNLLKV